MIRVAIALVSGSMAAFYAPAIPDLFWISYLPLLIWLTLFNPRYRFLTLVVAAWMWASLNIQHSLDTRFISDYENHVLTIKGVVADIPEQRPGSVRFLFQPDSITDYPGPQPDMIRLGWYRDQKELNAGERWQLQVKLKPPRGYQNPGGFDYERWMFVKGIGATGYVKTSQLNRLIETATPLDINWWRSQTRQRVNEHCPDCSQAGLINALTIGYRADIPTRQRQILQDTGTAHLLAISGLHIGMVAGLMFLLARWLWRPGIYRRGYNRLEFSAILSFVAGLSYAALAGFSLPTVRALIMLAVVFLALVFRSGINLINSIAIAVVVILLIEPLAVGSSSFWLSISALLIIAFAQYLLSNETSRWRQLALLQLMFSVLLVPLSIALFDQLNPASFFANIVAIPLVSLIVVPFSLLGSLAAAFDLAAANWLLLAGNHLLGLLLNYLEFLLDSGMSAYPAGDIPYALLGMSAIGLLVILMPKGFPAKKPAMLLLALPLIWQRPEIEPGAYQMTLLDVGMGTSAVIQTRNHSLIYDFGPGNARGFSSAQWTLMPYLRHQGIQKPDLMIISHVDQDHSGGFNSYLQTYDPARLVSGTPDEVENRFGLSLPVQSCHQRGPWVWDGVGFEFISTAQGSTPQSSNNRSCVLKVSGLHSSLLPGDIEGEQERRLLAEVPEKLNASVLVAPHHGSNTSSTPGFRAKVSPEVLVFTVGKNNRWGFPKAAVLEAYRLSRAQIFRTDVHGAVTIRSSTSGLEIAAQRKNRFNLWH